MEFGLMFLELLDKLRRREKMQHFYMYITNFLKREYVHSSFHRSVT